MNALVIAFFAMVAIAAAVPASPPSPGRPVRPEGHKPEAHKHEGHQEPIAIISQSSEVNPDGSSRSEYETADGTKVSEERNQEGEVQGRYSWTDPNGTLVEMTITAGKDGVKVEGSHLPVAQPIPEAIQKALEWNKMHPEQDYQDEEEKEKELPKKKY